MKKTSRTYRKTKSPKYKGKYPTRVGPKVKFYDVKGRKKFQSNQYRYVSRRVNKRNVIFAVTRAPSGIEAWRIVKTKVPEKK